MSGGAARYVANRSESPATGRAAVNPDRAAAQKLKFGARFSNNSPLPIQSAAVAGPNYTSNQPAYTQHQYENNAPHQRSTFDTSSISEDFDDTITSDLALQQHPDDNLEDYGRAFDRETATPKAVSQFSNQPIPSHSIHRKQSQTPVLNSYTNSEPQKSFHPPAPKPQYTQARQQGNSLPVRPVDNSVSATTQLTPRKRLRSGEGNAQNPTIFGLRSSQQDQVDGDDYPRVGTLEGPETIDTDEEDDPATPSASPRRNRRTQKTSSQVVKFDDQAMPQAEPVYPQYNDDELRRMTLAKLQNESWEKKDNSTILQYTKGVKDSSTLADKLEGYVKEGTQEAQAMFFGQLSAEEWEASGDWFVEKFAGTMTRLKDQIKAKRAVAKKYEDAIAAREKLVRGKSDGLDREFSDMRAGGEDILRKKKF